MVFKKKFDIKGSDANTLCPSYLGTNKDGWTIKGEVHEDYYEWVNEFEAVHPKHGKVWGDFEGIVYADSKEGYKEFVKRYPPNEWDYYDI